MLYLAWAGFEMKAKARSGGGDSRYDPIGRFLPPIFVVFLVVWIRFLLVVLTAFCLLLLSVLKALGEEVQG